MPRAEFEEKEYEMAFNIELAAGGGAVFSSGQVLEKIVGYDAAGAPDRDHAVWQILSVPRPKGLRLVQTHWRPGDMRSNGTSDRGGSSYGPTAMKLYGMTPRISRSSGSYTASNSVSNARETYPSAKDSL